MGMRKSTRGSREESKETLLAHYSKFSNPLSEAGSLRFSQRVRTFPVECETSLHSQILRKPASGAASARNAFGDCTISGQGAVHGVHSIENTCTYKRVFSIDWKNRRSTRRSFFDSFL